MLPPPFVPLPSSEGVAATISLHQRPALFSLRLFEVDDLTARCFTCAFYWRRVCVHQCWRLRIWPKVCVSWRGRRLERTGWGHWARFGCACQTNVWENEGSVQTWRSIGCKIDSDRALSHLLLLASRATRFWQFWWAGTSFQILLPFPCNVITQPVPHNIK